MLSVKLDLAYEYDYIWVLFKITICLGYLIDSFHMHLLVDFAFALRFSCLPALQSIRNRENVVLWNRTLIMCMMM